MSTVTLSNNWSYDRMMRLFGGMWFMLLALCVAIKIGASLADPWPSLLSSFCLASFYMLLALLIMTRSPAKAQAEGLLPRIAAFVGTYLPWTITFFGKTDQALPNLAVHRLCADRHHHDACHRPTSRSGRSVWYRRRVQWCRPVLIDGSSTHSTSRKKSRSWAPCCNT